MDHQIKTRSLFKTGTVCDYSSGFARKTRYLKLKLNMEAAFEALKLKHMQAASAKNEFTAVHG